MNTAMPPSMVRRRTRVQTVACPRKEAQKEGKKPSGGQTEGGRELGSSPRANCTSILSFSRDKDTKLSTKGGNSSLSPSREDDDQRML